MVSPGTLVPDTGKIRPYRKEVMKLTNRPTETVMITHLGKPALLVNIMQGVYLYRLGKTPQRILRLQSPRGSSVFDVADLNGDGNDDICFFDGERIWVYLQNAKGRFRPDKKYGLRLRSLMPGSASRLNRLRILFDLNKDGYPELIFPGIRHYLVYSNQKGSLKLAQKVRAKFVTSVSDRIWKNSDIRATELRGKIYLPKLTEIDLNRDGYPDFYTVYRKKLSLYLNDGKGKLGRRRQVYFPVDLENLYGSHAFLKRIDGDPWPEAVYTVIKGSGVDIRARNYIFRGRENFRFDKRKPLTYEEPGGFFYPLTPRIDGKNLFISPKIDIGLSFVVSYLVQGKLRIRINQLEMKHSPAGPDEKDQAGKKTGARIEKRSSYVLSYEVAGNLLPGFAQGDFDGDGNEEFAVGQEPELIKIYKARDGVFRSEAEGEIIGQGYGIFRALDLDQNGRDDLLIVYPYDHKELGYSQQKMTLLFF